MKIYCPHATSFDYVRDFYGLIRLSPLWARHTFILPHDGNNGDVHSRDWIAQADLVLAEVSYPSTGMGIELGWAYDSGRLIVAMHREGTKPTSALGFITPHLFAYTPERFDDILGDVIVLAEKRPDPGRSLSSGSLTAKLGGQGDGLEVEE